MKTEEGPVAITIQTTDIHLPRRIGEALRRALKGALGRRRLLRARELES